MIKQFALLISILLSVSTYAQYDIAVKVDGLTCSDELLLANHFGDNQYLKDTSECSEGIFHFKGDKSLTTGVYLIVLPKQNYFEILISKDEDQTKYFFQTDTTLKPAITSVKGSKENELFLGFNQYAVKQSIKASALSKEIDAEEDSAAKSIIQKELRTLGSSVSQRRKELAKANPTLFIGRLYNSMGEVDSPEFPEDLDPKKRSELQYRWMREHYWDNVDFSEDGLVLSPIFHGKLKSYFETYMPPIPDTAILMGDNLIAKIEQGGSTEQFKYTLHFLLGYFEESKYICFDKALWHMAKNYYCAGKAFWADSAYIATMCEYVSKNEGVLCDKTAPNMNMPDTTFKNRISLYSIDKPVTVVVFWDINCGTCKKEMPKISQMYDSMTNEHIEVYAVYTKSEFEKWKKRVRDEKFNFINVVNGFKDDNYHVKYNITSVPQIYVLDKDKKIRFKKIDAESLPNAINYLLEEQGVIEKDPPAN
jgi:thiol-disulfide isomerase/thioredoxin